MRKIDAPASGIFRAAGGLSLRAALGPAGAGGTNRELPHPDEQGRFRWVLATGRPVKIYDWERGEFVDEVLLLEGLAHPDRIPLLDSHNRNSAADQIGSVSGFALDPAGGMLTGLVQFSEADELSRATAAKVQEGHITDGSIGYRVLRSVWVPEEQSVNIGGRDFTGPLRVTTAARLLEFSITPIGADDMAKVRQ